MRQRDDVYTNLTSRTLDVHASRSESSSPKYHGHGDFQYTTGRIGFLETRYRSHAVVRGRNHRGGCRSDKFLSRRSSRRRLTFERKPRISLPRTGHVDKPREERTDNATGHRREERDEYVRSAWRVRIDC